MIAVSILITVFALASVVAMLWVFVWAARKDGEDDQERQRKLGIKRRTRIGR